MTMPTTAHPWAAALSAVAAPIPREAPVTNSTRGEDDPEAGKVFNISIPFHGF